MEMDPRSPAMYAFLAGLIVFALGIALIGHTFVPQTESGTLAIPAGPSYRYVPWSVTSGGSADVDYSVTSGGPVIVMILDGGNFARFSTGQSYAVVSSAGGSAGTLTAEVPGFGTYFLVFTHDPSDTGRTQELSAGILLTGVDPFLFFSGFAMGLIGAYIGLKGRNHFSTAPRRRRPSAQARARMGFALPPDPTAPDPVPGTPPSATLLVTLRNPSPVEETVNVRVNGTDYGSVQVPAQAEGRARITVALPSKFGAPATVDAVRKDGRSTTRDVFLRAWDLTRVELKLE